LKKGFKNIIAIGGDGTINEVANGFSFSTKTRKKGHL
jgi:diacylglycerol kinase family enzyme